MSRYGTPVRSGVWLYGGTVPTGVRIVESPIAFGTGDYEDEPAERDDRNVKCFYVEWAVAGTVSEWHSVMHGPHESLAEAEAYVTKQSSETVVWQQ
jgi:hypothetical protein